VSRHDKRLPPRRGDEISGYALRTWGRDQNRGLRRQGERALDIVGKPDLGLYAELPVTTARVLNHRAAWFMNKHSIRMRATPSAQTLGS
jgi:hypothetical protein